MPVPNQIDEPAHADEAEPGEPARAEELAREQSLTELQQALGDREQLVGDRDQVRIDQLQLHHDEARQAGAGKDRLAPILDDRQARIDREQFSRDVNQEGLDHAQAERDNQQTSLDAARMTLSLPIGEQPEVADAAALQRGAMDRAAAARKRAEAAVARAQAAVLRAEAAESRARGLPPVGSA